MVKLLRPGSVIVDLAAEQGGNVEGTEAGKILEKDRITIIGAVNLPSTIPVHASQMYGKNLIDLFLLLYPKEASTPNLEEEIAKECCITHDGKIVNERVKSMLENGGTNK
jgi:NAD(P) transhydrogenase subunit alpha